MTKYAIALIGGMMALTGCGGDDDGTGDDIMLMDADVADATGLQRDTGTRPGRPDARVPDAEAPAPMCDDTGVVPPFDGAACAADTLTCLMGAMTNEAFAACLDADPNADDCNACTNQNIISCVNEAGGKGAWDCYVGCVNENCPEDGSCIETTCSEQNDAYNDAVSDAGSSCSRALLDCFPAPGAGDDDDDDDDATPAADGGASGGGGEGGGDMTLPLPEMIRLEQAIRGFSR